MRHIYSGKVRDVYEIDEERLLFVTSDRVSAFDVVMAEPVPAKGRVLTALTAFWLGELSDVAPSHLLEVGVPGEAHLGDAHLADGHLGDAHLADGHLGDGHLAGAGLSPAYLEGRSMVVRKAQMLPLECIVRGYLSGSAWEEYRRSGTMHGKSLPAGMQQSDKLPEPVFTPSTKATSGHDENISFEAASDLVGDKLAAAAREISLEAYRTGAERAAAHGIIIADTKFELGMIDGELAICDEVLTPDSSRFWPADKWQPGSTPPSFDKQPLRDWLTSSGWDKSPPPPQLPAHVVRSTSERYIEAYEKLSGLRFADWPGARQDQIG